MRIILTSNSEIKFSVLEKFLMDTYIDHTEIVCLPVPRPEEIPNQPLDAFKCAHLRIDQILSSINDDDLVVSIENGIREGSGDPVDICVVIYLYRGNRYEGMSDISFGVPSDVFEEAKKLSLDNVTELGMSVTVGELLGEKLSMPKNRWMNHPCYGPETRETQIMDALRDAMSDELLLRVNIVYDPNFKHGIVFQDMSRILAARELREKLQDMLHEKFVSAFGCNVTKVVGLDSRGYIYASMLSPRCSGGFVMARKKGKTPGEFRSETYTTEYSSDTIEIMEGLLGSGDRVVIVDDLVATGGSLCAARRLVEAFGAEVVGSLVILQVKDLFQRASNAFGKPIHVLLP
jgi:adenine phosphoribosyltransferase